MAHLDHPLFNPYASSESLTEDALKKGLIEPGAAERLIRAAEWVEENTEVLFERFGTDVVIVVADEEAEGGFALYPGEDLFECWSRARQFSPGMPWVAYDPTCRTFAPALFDLPEGGLSLIASVIAKFGGVGPFFQQNGGQGGGDAGKAEAAYQKFLKDRLKAIENALKKKKLKELLPVVKYDQIRVGGALASGKFSVPKDWLVDTGASSSLISKSNFDALVKKGAKPKKIGELKAETAGGVVTVPVFGGLTMRFARKDADKKPEIVECTTPLAVGPIDLLGVDQLKNTKTRLLFDPANGIADLRGRKKK
ncbi:MAG: hypothetical protein JJ911_00540 [Rhizobiaceae bacterium]|nr:hypothetical protein [Rhizobiaceae bacterium]